MILGLQPDRGSCTRSGIGGRGHATSEPNGTKSCSATGTPMNASGTPVNRDGRNASPFVRPQHTKLGLANSDCVGEYSFEHGLQFARRPGDYLQYLGGRRLLLQRLVALTGPLVELPLQVGCRGTATACIHRLLAALELRCFAAPSFHCYAARCCATATRRMVCSARAINDQTVIPPSSEMNSRRFM